MIMISDQNNKKVRTTVHHSGMSINIKHNIRGNDNKIPISKLNSQNTSN